jgi:rhamnogalacturonan endolyase
MKLSVTAAYLSLLAPALADFGITTSGSDMLVDTGGGLVVTGMRVQSRLGPRLLIIVFTIVNTGSGDITSIDYNGVELQDQSKFTHLSSGLGKDLVKSA